MDKSTYTYTHMYMSVCTHDVHSSLQSPECALKVTSQSPLMLSQRTYGSKAIELELQSLTLGLQLSSKTLIQVILELSHPSMTMSSMYVRVCVSDQFQLC